MYLLQYPSACARTTSIRLSRIERTDSQTGGDTAGGILWVSRRVQSKGSFGFWVLDWAQHDDKVVSVSEVPGKTERQLEGRRVFRTRVQVPGTGTLRSCRAVVIIAATCETHSIRFFWVLVWVIHKHGRTSARLLNTLHQVTLWVQRSLRGSVLWNRMR